MGMKVFISSTYVDLKEYRQAAINVVNRYKHISLSMEFFGAQPEDPITVSKNELQECDIFIGIYAHRYGFVPKDRKRSITQLEYELAKRLEKYRLCFIVDMNHPWPVPLIEMDKYPSLEAFLEKVKKDHVVEFFKSPEDFSMKLAISIGNLNAKLRKPTVKKEYIIIPPAPTPYFAHTYPMPDHFTGRDAEKAILSNWFFNETEPMLVMEAMGGMGKSALSWVWLKQVVQERSVEVDGVFWWSFYNEPFDSFIQYLDCYVMEKEESQGVDLSRLLDVLHQRRFLLVLDGLERTLRGYAGTKAMSIQERQFEGKSEEENGRERRPRDTVHPWADRFLKSLTNGNSKTLVTTRLMPATLKGLRGVKHIFLKGLLPTDAVRFFRSEGVKGIRAELEQASEVYDYHPLMLKLLASAIKYSRVEDIKDAFRLNIIDREEPSKILNENLKLLSEEEREVGTSIAVFRGSFTFDSAKALLPDIDKKHLLKVLQELRNLGFLFYDEKEGRFDFRPLIRPFLYNQLTSRTNIHSLAAQYFKTLPKKEEIVTFKDLAPVIEHHHHLVKAGNLDEAFELFRDEIHEPAYFQLSAYPLIIELLEELFSKDEGQTPKLKSQSDQARALNELANSYCRFGQPAKAVPLFLLHNKLREKNKNKNENEKDFAIGLENVALMAQFHIGQFSAACTHLRKGTSISLEIKDKLWEAVGHQELGHILAFQDREEGKKTSKPLECESDFAKNEFNKALELDKERDDYQGLGLTYAYSSLSFLLCSRLAAVLPEKEKHSTTHSLKALEEAQQALAFAEKTAETTNPIPRDFVQAYLLLGETLIQCHLLSPSEQKKMFELHFYDEPFQSQVDFFNVKNGRELAAAERCLNEALRRCRKINMVDSEPDILLALARLEWAKELPIDENILKEAMEISLRAGYRLKLADLHLFCGQVLLETKGAKTLLDLNANEHLQKAKEYALDVSEFKHLYQSDDLHFYDNIPEYEMLKRGMTEEERIRNGYWVAYKIAEELERRGSG